MAALLGPLITHIGCSNRLRPVPVGVAVHVEDGHIAESGTSPHTGVRRSTMDNIAREAGMSRPAVYQYVRNKQDAFRRLAARLLDAALADARAAIATPGDLTEQLTGVLEAKLGLAARLWHDSPAHAAELLGVETRQSADLVEAYNDAMRDLLTSAIATTRPDLSKADAGEVAELLLAFTRGLEADLADPEAPARRLRHGVALLIAGLDHDHPDKEAP
ncbi:TetR/AcrR family transcriptional regulator [Streptomyces sp. NPDC057616]|uniref:TetR/AcrR family transcriptional regulator n=1 Tax=Streptomyces sp. NPDC057616 TaxID=3346183 RepID=UPI0036B79AF3